MSKMSKFTFYVEGADIDVSAVAASYEEACKLVWASLSDEQKNATVCLDWIDTEEVAA